MARARTTWPKIIHSMKHCETCLSYSTSPFAVVRSPPPSFEPPNPRDKVFRKGIRVLFVSEAPPGGSHYGHFFWSEALPDGLRSQLLKACYSAKLVAQKSLKSFVASGFYLLPTVPAATERMGRYNENPSPQLLKHSAVTHLKEAIRYIRPERIFLLGESALDGAYHVLRDCSQDFRRDFESYSTPLRKILRSKSPYLMKADWGTFWLHCSYWPRNGKNFPRMVEDLRLLQRHLTHGAIPN